MALRPVWSDGPLGKETRKPARGNVNFHSWHLPRGSELAPGKRRQTGSCRRNLRRGWKFWCWSHELYRPHPQLRPDTQWGGENRSGKWRRCSAAHSTPPGPLPQPPSAGCLPVLSIPALGCRGHALEMSKHKLWTLKGFRLPASSATS